MLLELLKRDLRLHYDALLLPFLFALVMAGLHPFNPELPIIGPVLGFVVAAFLPLVLHLREDHAGTLGELAGLPVSRRTLVQVRFLEGFLLPALLLLFSNLVIAGITRTPPALPKMELMLPLGWALFWCFAFFLPFALRWDGKGLISAFGLLFALGIGISLTRFLSAGMQMAFAKGLVSTFEFFGNHPSLHTVLLLGLFTLSFELSTRAFAARDL